jgi:hypothetical protein
MSHWSQAEVAAIVADYFSMLHKELQGGSYNKAEHRRQLTPLLNGRSNSSIEFKHQNISAVLVHFGLPYIRGYLPRFNYQTALEEEVSAYLTTHPAIEQSFKDFAETSVNAKVDASIFKNLLVAAPNKNNRVEEEIPTYKKSPVKINYLQKEQENRNLGQLGEGMVVAYEQWALSLAGKEALAQKVKWISKEEGDGAGYDILSSYLDGREKYIEVKTTKLSKETPFYFSRNELLFSQAYSSQYELYRLFHFGAKTKLFIKKGSLDKMCSYEPIVYRGAF